MTAQIFLGFSSIPQWLTMNPKNFPELTPKMYFLGLSFTLYFISSLNAFSRCFASSTGSLELVIMFSMYTSIVRPINDLKILVTNLWYIAQAFF